MGMINVASEYIFDISLIGALVKVHRSGSGPDEDVGIISDVFINGVGNSCAKFSYGNQFETITMPQLIAGSRSIYILSDFKDTKVDLPLMPLG